MTSSVECTENTDPTKLVREGTSQEQRMTSALDPSYAPINERKIEHCMAFAQAYSEYLKYYDSNDTVSGGWLPFFSKDVSVLLAIAAVQNVEHYKSRIKEFIDFLNNRDHTEKDLKTYFGYLFSYVGTLASQLDALKEGLPDDASLPTEVALFKGTLQNLIKSQLAPEFKKLFSYYKEAVCSDLAADTTLDEQVLGSRMIKFSALPSFSKDWITTDAANWDIYLKAIKPFNIDAAGSVFERINRIVTHNFFIAIFDQFLKVLARVVNDAQKALNATFKWNGHEPHYALFLTFLKLLEQINSETNLLTKLHLDFYYKEVLKLKEKPSMPSHAHLLVELAKQVKTHELKAGELFKAGKDDRGVEAFFANDRDCVANEAKVASLKTIYRHGTELVGEKLPSNQNNGRIYASPIANSDDGTNTELTTIDHSWHPFFNKTYLDEVLTAIKMPQAAIGFAIASHYLWMAEGTRKITVDCVLSEKFTYNNNFDITNVVCFLTSDKGWIEKTATMAFDDKVKPKHIRIVIELSGADPSVTPYLAKTHSYNFNTALPILLIKLKHDASPYAYNKFQDVLLTQINLSVEVGAEIDGIPTCGLKKLAISNDFGPVDTSKPFQPFGAQPVNGANFIIGSKEIFQKNLTSLSLQINWQNEPSYYQSQAKDDSGNVSVTSNAPKVNISYLRSGNWDNPTGSFDFNSNLYELGSKPNVAVIEAVDLVDNEFYNVSSRNGFLRLVLDGDLGFKQYQTDLAIFFAKITTSKPDPHPGSPILGPFANSVSITYVANQEILLSTLTSSEESYRKPCGLFFHIGPFGVSEEHSYLKEKIPDTKTNFPDQDISLLPQFKHFNTTDNKFLIGEPVQHEAEFYIGVTGLKPPQNISLLFQVADGTADQNFNKPDSHIHWSYLRDNKWISFAKNEVGDRTKELLDSNIITFAMPHDASDTNTLLPAGMHWIRAAVASGSDAVCKLRLIAAQAFSVTFTDRGNDSTFPAKILPSGTINKLDQHNANIKQIIQPFSSFGGRREESTSAFYTRVSERLRHKDRGITLWDYERLVLEAFPEIYRAKCLNHTYYETDERSISHYKELAPGHVTIVTIPNLRLHKVRDPLKPLTSSVTLSKIKEFFRNRLSCFVNLHVKNPQFEEVSVACKVRLHDGYDKTYFLNKLHEAIIRFLSPWAFSDDANPSFGGRIYKSVLINKVEDLLYVDYVTDFQLFHSVIINGSPVKSEKNVVDGSKAISMLVSAKKHEITVIDPVKEDTLREISLSKI